MDHIALYGSHLAGHGKHQEGLDPSCAVSARLISACLWSLLQPHCFSGIQTSTSVHGPAAVVWTVTVCGLKLSTNSITTLDIRWGWLYPWEPLENLFSKSIHHQHHRSRTCTGWGHFFISHMHCIIKVTKATYPPFSQLTTFFPYVKNLQEGTKVAVRCLETCPSDQSRFFLPS